jgi:hypothetical protein
MARRRTQNRYELRAAAEAAERRATASEEEDQDDETEDADRDAAEDDAAEGEEDEEAVARPAKPAKKKAPREKTTKARSRASKSIRLRASWGVFNNSNQRVATFEYPRRAEADALVAKLMTEKKSAHFVQLIKEPIEEKKGE